MQLLIWAGAMLTVAGLAGLVLCIVRAVGLRRAALPDDQTRAALARLLPLNLGALLLSAFGLMLVVTGVLLS
jgi:hypothetical protein